ncbi:hypothetical protein YB2330_004874 [Saitoella coloradoensis]
MDFDQDPLSPTLGSAPVSPTSGLKPGDGAGPADQKRRRIARACDMCRRKKIKCDGKLPRCTHCSNYGTDCTFKIEPKKRTPQPKGASAHRQKYIERLEDRLERMEGLLRGVMPNYEPQQLGLLEQGTEVPVQASTTRKNSSASQPRLSFSGVSPDEGDEGDEEHSDDEPMQELTSRMGVLLSHSDAAQSYLGGSSGISFLSDCKDFVKDLFDESNFPKAPPRDDLIGGQPVPLPTKDIADTLVDAFFAGVITIFPIIEREQFDENYQKMWADNPPLDDVPWMAVYYMVMAFGAVELSAKDGARDGGVDPEAGKNYFYNAWQLNNMLYAHNTLMALQAMLMMGIFLQGTSRVHAAWIQLGATVRLAQALGLHRGTNLLDIGPFVNAKGKNEAQRQRVWWIIYIFDKSLAMTLGRPAAIHDADCDVPLPPKDDEEIKAHCQRNLMGDLQTLAEGTERFNFFRHVIDFANLTSHVCSNMYSAAASKIISQPQKLAELVSELDAELIAWRDEIPIVIRPDQPADPVTGAEHIERIDAPREHMRAIAMLHLSYYNCICVIHRPGLLCRAVGDNWADKAPVNVPNPRIYASGEICVNGARRKMALLKFLHDRKLMDLVVWLFLHYVFSSCAILFIQIIKFPQASSAQMDLRLIGTGIQILTEAKHLKRVFAASKVLQLIRKLFTNAAAAIEAAEKQDSSRKRQFTNDEQAAAATGSEVPMPTLDIPINADFGGVPTASFNAQMPGPGMAQTSGQLPSDLISPSVFYNTYTQPQPGMPAPAMDLSQMSMMNSWGMGPMDLQQQMQDTAAFQMNNIAANPGFGMGMTSGFDPSLQPAQTWQPQPPMSFHWEDWENYVFENNPQ